MPNNLRFAIMMVALLLYVVIFLLFKKGRVPVKYVLVWLFPATIILLLAIMPNIFYKFMYLLGFQTVSNMVVGFLILILFFLVMALTVIISGQQKKIILLIQEVSILKSTLNNTINQDEE